MKKQKAISKKKKKIVRKYEKKNNQVGKKHCLIFLCYGKLKLNFMQQNCNQWSKVSDRSFYLVHKMLTKEKFTNDVISHILHIMFNVDEYLE